VGVFSLTALLSCSEEPSGALGSNDATPPAKPEPISPAIAEPSVKAGSNTDGAKPAIPELTADKPPNKPTSAFPNRLDESLN